MATKNSWNNTISNADVTLNGGTVSIGTDAVGNAINVGTGAAARTMTIGNTNLKTGTGDFTLASATGTIMNAADTGEINYPLQPAFLARLNVDRNNVTGDGTIYTIDFGAEVFDQGNNFNNTTTFTAPVTGKYVFYATASIIDLTDNHTTGYLDISTSNRSYKSCMWDWGTFRSPAINGNQVTLTHTVCCDMDIADIMQFRVKVSNSTKVVDINTSGVVNPFTTLSGYLVA